MWQRLLKNIPLPSIDSVGVFSKFCAFALLHFGLLIFSKWQFCFKTWRYNFAWQKNLGIWLEKIVPPDKCWRGSVSDRHCRCCRSPRPSHPRVGSSSPNPASCAACSLQWWCRGGQQATGERVSGAQEEEEESAKWGPAPVIWCRQAAAGALQGMRSSLVIAGGVWWSEGAEGASQSVSVFISWSSSNAFKAVMNMYNCTYGQLGTRWIAHHDGYALIGEREPIIFFAFLFNLLLKHKFILWLTYHCKMK